MQPSNKQMSMIMHSLRGESGKLLLSKLPKNSKKYPDIRADYSEAILSDFIRENFNIQEASRLIRLLLDWKFMDAEIMLKTKGLNLTNANSIKETA